MVPALTDRVSHDLLTILQAEQKVHFPVASPDPGPEVVAASSHSHLLRRKLNHVAPGDTRHLCRLDDLLENLFVVAEKGRGGRMQMKLIFARHNETRGDRAGSHVPDRIEDLVLYSVHEADQEPALKLPVMDGKDSVQFQQLPGNADLNFELPIAKGEDRTAPLRGHGGRNLFRRCEAKLLHYVSEVDIRHPVLLECDSKLLSRQDPALKQQQSEGDARAAHLCRLALKGHQLRDLPFDSLIKAVWATIPVTIHVHSAIAMGK